MILFYNKELLNKRIIIDNRFDYDENEYNNIMTNFGDIKKLSLISEGNIEPISITEYKQTICRGRKGHLKA